MTAGIITGLITVYAVGALVGWFYGYLSGREDQRKDDK